MGPIFHYHTYPCIQLTWSNWDAVCDFIPKSLFISGIYIDPITKLPLNPLLKGSNTIGLYIRNKEGKAILVKEDQFLVKISPKDIKAVYTLEELNIMDANAVADEIINAVEGLKSLSGTKKIGDLINVAPIVLSAIETKATAMAMSSAEKKEVAVVILDRLVKIPGVPSKLKTVFFGHAVDAAIALANKVAGKKWGVKA